MKVKEAYYSLRKRLCAVTDEARTEASLIFAHYAGIAPSEAIISETELDESALEAIERAAERRLLHEPLQYILGSWGFMGLEFIVAPCALIPRQDTETLCEEALRLISERGCKTLLDICTGTGCIAISLAKLGGVKAEASDISPECVSLARKNSLKNGVEIFLRIADLFEGAGRYDIVTANPPYISDKDMETLSEEVKREPALALRGGADGLDFYRRIAEEASAHINKGGVLLMEVGAGEAEAVAALFPENETRIADDLGGIGRIVIAEY